MHLFKDIASLWSTTFGGRSKPIAHPGIRDRRGAVAGNRFNESGGGSTLELAGEIVDALETANRMAI